MKQVQKVIGILFIVAIYITTILSQFEGAFLIESNDIEVSVQQLESKSQKHLVSENSTEIGTDFFSNNKTLNNQDFKSNFRIPQGVFFTPEFIIANNNRQISNDARKICINQRKEDLIFPKHYFW